MPDPNIPKDDSRPPIATPVKPDKTNSDSVSNPEKLTEGRAGFTYRVLTISEELDHINEGDEPLRPGSETENFITDNLCKPFLPTADEIPPGERHLLYSALTNIIARLKDMSPKLAEAVEIATLDILRDLKGKMESDNHRGRLKNILADPQYGPGEPIAAVRMYAQRSIDELKRVLNELRRVESFSNLESASKGTLLGIGLHTYTDFIQHCGSEAIEEYYRLIHQVHELAEKKGDAFFEIAVRGPLERLKEFLRQEK